MRGEKKNNSVAAGAAPRTHWQVCAGDPTFVSVPDVVKPIACGSQERARLIVRAVNSHLSLLAALTPFAETPTTSETPGVARDDEADALIFAAREAIAKAAGGAP